MQNNTLSKKINHFLFKIPVETEGEDVQFHRFSPGRGSLFCPLKKTGTAPNTMSARPEIQTPTQPP
jgi:hypothetical protein